MRNIEEESGAVGHAVAGGVVGAGTYGVVGGVGVAVGGTAIALGLGSFIAIGAIVGLAAKALRDA